MFRIYTVLFLFLLIISSACNPWTIEYPLIYTSESPNDQFAQRLKVVLEDAYNVDIRLVKANSADAIVDSLEHSDIDMALLENFVNHGNGINTVVPIFPKVLHLFYDAEQTPEDVYSLFYNHTVYIGPEGSASQQFMLELFDFFHLDLSKIELRSEMDGAEVLALFRVIMTDTEMQELAGYQLFSLGEATKVGQGSVVEGIALRYPRVRPFVIPVQTYGRLTADPVVTIATDMMFVVKENMTWLSINDLIHSLFEHREQFVHVHPAFYSGLLEDFDRSKLSYPLHEGARSYLNRDEPGLFERYAELVGVIFTIVVALVSGVISFSKKREQKKKDKIDVFYAHLMKVKNELSELKTVAQVKEKVEEIKAEQNRAFNMLIKEELQANESFRIYMELSKETISELAARMRAIRAKESA